ncbi:MAG: hypothetical protein HY565_05050 [Candidatus Kerfeldbacteria bacterium]|nr:hypothetical protein [Candidatus Kerfeldbacteria bacterium]
MTSYQRLLLSGGSVAGLLNVASWLLAVLWFDRTAPTVILHYNIYFGPDGFGSWLDLLTMPGIGTVMIVINSGLAMWLWQRDRFLSYVMMITAVIVQAVILVAMLLLIKVN